MNAQSTVLTCAVAVAGLGLARSAVAGKPPTTRLVVGGVVFTIMLAGLAETAPQLAVGIAALSTTSALLIAGPPVLSAVTKLTR